MSFSYRMILLPALIVATAREFRLLKTSAKNECSMKIHRNRIAIRPTEYDILACTKRNEQWKRIVSDIKTDYLTIYEKRFVGHNKSGGVSGMMTPLFFSLFLIMINIAKKPWNSKLFRLNTQGGLALVLRMSDGHCWFSIWGNLLSKTRNFFLISTWFDSSLGPWISNDLRRESIRSYRRCNKILLTPEKFENFVVSIYISKWFNSSRIYWECRYDRAIEGHYSKYHQWSNHRIYAWTPFST